jgi:hypothetical protein
MGVGDIPDQRRYYGDTACVGCVWRIETDLIRLEYTSNETSKISISVIIYTSSCAAAPNQCAVFSLNGCSAAIGQHVLIGGVQSEPNVFCKRQFRIEPYVSGI